MAFIRKTPSGTWKVGWRDPEGVQRYKTFKTKRAASAYVAELESTLHKGLYVDPHAGRRLFGPYAEAWFAARSYEPSTVHATGSVFRCTCSVAGPTCRSVVSITRPSRSG
jgi:hypothetical protein